MAAHKTTKPSANIKAKTPAKGMVETGKKVAAKAKAAVKAPVKSKIVPKVAAKTSTVAAHGKPAKSGPVTKSVKTASKTQTNGKKIIVSASAVKTSSEAKKPVQVGKAAAHNAKPAPVAAKTSGKAPIAAAKPVATVKAVVVPVAKPVAPKAPVAAGKPAPAQPHAKVAPKTPAPAVVLPLKKLPVNGKPGALAAPATPVIAKVAPPLAKPVPQKVQFAPVVDPKKPVKPATQRHGFRTNEYIVYPSHGVGRIVRIEEQVVAGYSLELFVIHFEQEKMTLRVPTSKLASVGMRKLSETPIVDRAMETLKGRARIKRTMWSRRAQEYEAKINSGDLVAIAEVVRDLFRAETQPEQSYSERQLFEAALDRMSREVAAIENLDDRGATQKVLDVLSRSAKSRKAVEASAEATVTNGAERAA
jgi:CarD family transcriptional regulator